MRSIIAVVFLLGVLMQMGLLRAADDEAKNAQILIDIISDKEKNEQEKIVSLKEVLEKQKIDINAKSLKGTTALHHVSFWNYPEIVKWLIENGADMNAKHGPQEWTALHLAVNADHVEIVKLLLKKGANVNAKDKDGNTPLDWANNDEIKTYLISMKGESGHKTSDDEAKNAQILIDIISDKEKNEQEKIVSLKGVLEKKKIDINAKGLKGTTALHYVSFWNYPEIVKWLIDNGADINAKYGSQEWTALHLAVNAGRFEIVKLLLKKGANVNAKDKAGNTPLDWADNDEITAYLVLMKGEPGHKTSDEESALFNFAQSLAQLIS